MRIQFWTENMTGRDHLEGLSVNEKIILENLKVVGWEGLD